MIFNLTEFDRYDFKFYAIDDVRYAIKYIDLTLEDRNIVNRTIDINMYIFVENQVYIYDRRHVTLIQTLFKSGLFTFPYKKTNDRFLPDILHTNLKFKIQTIRDWR